MEIILGILAAIFVNLLIPNAKPSVRVFATFVLILICAILKGI